MIRKLSSILIFILIFCASSDASKSYQSGELWSRKTVTYGKFDVVMKPAEGSGIISSFFLFKEIPYPQHPWREIDIEVLGEKPDEISTNLIVDARNRTGNTLTHPIGVNLAKGFHTYTIEWTPTEISWYIDNKLIRQANKDIVKEFEGQALTFRFNLWATHLSDWAGEFEDHILPVEHSIQSITYYKYTPDETFKGKPFKFAWQDNFSDINTGRWRKADWTFPENLAQFNPRNIFIKKNQLIIQLNKQNKS